MQKVNHEKQIARLIDLVGRLEGVEAESVRSAKSFLAHLSKNYDTPRVAPDGDGGIVFVWEANKTTTILSVSCFYLNLMIARKGQPAIHLDDISYESGEIPTSILEHLPKKKV